MAFRGIWQSCLWLGCLVLLLTATGCKRGSGSVGRSEVGFEGKWLMVASETGDKAVDKETKENFGNYHKHYLMGLENGEYFFQAVSGSNEPSVGSPVRGFKRKGHKLVTDDGWFRVEYEIVKDQLVVSYYGLPSGDFSHKVTFQRE